MEVLSAQQSQFPGPFHVIGSNKVKDWTSPLTSPIQPHHRQPLLCNHLQNSRHHHSNSHYSSSINPTPVKSAIQSNITQDNDVVDGLSTKIIDGQYMQPEPNQSEIQQQYYHYQHNNHQPMSAAISKSLPRSSSSSVNVDEGVENAINVAAVYNLSRYNSNLICCGRSVADSGDVDVDAAAINELSIRLQSELRAAKSRHLACTEVSLPWDLTPRIAAEIIRVSEKEPCGIRGCTIYIEFEDEPSNTRRIASLKIDPNTVSTFELYLTLKHDKSGWTSLLPQFIKNLTKSSTILISPDFSLTKNKLYHSSSE